MYPRKRDEEETVKTREIKGNEEKRRQERIWVIMAQESKMSQWKRGKEGGDGWHGRDKESYDGLRLVVEQWRQSGGYREI